MTGGVADKSIRVSVPSDPAYLGIVRALVECVARLAGFAEPEVSHVVVALDEACTNIIRHQYEGRRDERIDIEALLDLEAGRVQFVLRDYGPVRDPKHFRGRDLADVRPGGLGLHIIRKVMDEVEYSAAPGGGMLLKLCKRACRQTGQEG